MELPFFKKKKENFSFDDEPNLPSLSDVESSEPPKNFDSNLGKELNHGLGELPKNAFVSTDDYSDSSLEKENESFSSNMNSFGPSSYKKSSNEDDSNKNSIPSDNRLLNAKIETIEAKLSLAQANIATIEHKIDMIYKMVVLEISDETRKTLRLNEMRDSLKKM